MNYSFVIACDITGIIAIDGKIPWSGNLKYSNDLKNFRTLTENSIIIMSSKTFESLPNRKLLPNRINVVISRRGDIIKEVDSQGGLVFSNIATMHGVIAKKSIKEVFVIGGVETFHSMRHLITKYYVTIIPEEFKVDESRVTRFPLDELLLIDPKPFLNNLDNNDMRWFVQVVNLNSEDEQYSRLISKILSSDNYTIPERDRTGFGFKSIYGDILKFDISNGKIPLTTLRSQPFRWIVEELLWFLKGQTDNRILKSAKVNVWTKNTTKIALTKAGLEYDEDIAGPIYGFQWRHANGNYDEKDPDGFRSSVKPTLPIKNGIDQIVKIIQALINPETRYSRRHLLNGWNVAQLDKMALPPCHVLYQFHVDAKEQLHCTFYQRSSDVALACSWNATSAAILTNILAEMTNLNTGTLTMFIANAHIYTNHFENAKKILDRKPYKFPTLRIVDIRHFNNSTHPKSELITDEMISDALQNLQSSQFSVENYYAHPDISFDMNA